MSHKSNNRRANQAQVYEALHKKRTAEYEAREQWAGVTQYFKTWENNSNKFTNWTSPQYYKKSAELQLEIQRREQRRLEEEQEEWEKWQKKIRDRQREDEEFKKGQMKKKPISLSRPNSAGQQQTQPSEEMAMELKRKQDAVMNREIELRLHAQSKSCDPKQAKQYEMRVRQRSSESSWDDRMEERKSADQKRQEQSKNEQRLSEESLMAERTVEEDKQRSRQNRATELKNELVGQVAELKMRSDRCEELKKIESKYLVLQSQIENIEHRNDELDGRKKHNLSRSKVLRQYLTMLKQRSKEMVEFLREDQKLLDDLNTVIHHSNVTVDLDLNGKVNELKDLFSQYEDDENQRLYLMEFMFEEEARNIWRSHEERWKSEYVVRKTKVGELFTLIKTQLENQIDKGLNEQRKLIGEREELIGDIEKGNDELKTLEIEINEFYKQHPEYNNNDHSSDSKNYQKIENNAMKIADREHKLLNDMAYLNLLDDSKLTDHRRKKSVW
ncbi:Hypothetical protein CINCED_3A025372 [Cinara cedri]|uniref:Trichoplein keratin filament-binding protein n=1 Tax=Cinara cedri TaxID=506608 RepID=A0A5E4MXK5_9HEMI|nr:Hypothetical protein CINCED_3A025372 [Cinara cedri]